MQLWHRTKVLAAIVAALCGLTLALVPAAPATAHDGFVSATPAPGERIEDPVERVTIDFGPPVVNANLALIAPDGSRVETELVLIEDFGARMTFAPLAEPGVYTVRFLATAATDGHLLTGNYTFGFRADPPEVEGEGSLAIWIVVSWIALAVVGGLTMFWVRNAKAKLSADA